MSMNLTAHRNPCPCCNRSFEIDLHQTSTEVTWDCLYADKDRNYKRTWQETREKYTEWIMLRHKEHEKYLRDSGIKGKDLKYHMEQDLLFVKEHLSILDGDVPIEWSYI